MRKVATPLYPCFSPHCCRAPGVLSPPSQYSLQKNSISSSSRAVGRAAGSRRRHASSTASTDASRPGPRLGMAGRLVPLLLSRSLLKCWYSCSGDSSSPNRDLRGIGACDHTQDCERECRYTCLQTSEFVPSQHATCHKTQPQQQSRLTCRSAVHTTLCQCSRCPGQGL